MPMDEHFSGYMRVNDLLYVSANFDWTLVLNSVNCIWTFIVKLLRKLLDEIQLFMLFIFMRYTFRHTCQSTCHKIYHKQTWIPTLLSNETWKRIYD